MRSEKGIAEIKGCAHCTAIHDGMRNVVRLLGDEKVIEVPAGFGERLYSRLVAPMR